MYRSPVLFAVACCGVMAALYPVTLARSANDDSDRDEVHQRVRAQFIAAAEALNLYWVGDSIDRTSGRKLIFSDMPISGDRQRMLAINDPQFERWQGTVAVYVSGVDMWSSNRDVDFPTHSAILAGSFVYGDPEVIERLRAAMP